MDNQHKQIKGYRDLTAEEIALMNEIKELGERCGDLVQRLKNSRSPDERKAGVIEQIDQRWVAIGATELQQGFMALIRAVARPTTF